MEFLSLMAVSLVDFILRSTHSSISDSKFHSFSSDRVKEQRFFYLHPFNMVLVGRLRVKISPSVDQSYELIKLNYGWRRVSATVKLMIVIQIEVLSSFV